MFKCRVVELFNIPEYKDQQSFHFRHFHDMHPIPVSDDYTIILSFKIGLQEHLIYQNRRNRSIFDPQKREERFRSSVTRTRFKNKHGEVLQYKKSNALDPQSIEFNKRITLEFYASGANVFYCVSRGLQWRPSGPIQLFSTRVRVLPGICWKYWCVRVPARNNTIENEKCERKNGNSGRM